MVDCYLRKDFAVGELATVQDEAKLLGWTRAIADGALPRDIYRNKEGRKTLRFKRGGRSFFLKLHSGVGWSEIIKNLLQGRLPVVGAANEYHAVRALERIGVDTLSVAAYASTGRNPAAKQSLLVTDDLVGTVSLEDYCANWAGAPPRPRVRMRLILKLADSARRMHGAGINHRDFYLCHFHLDESSLAKQSLRCYLIDLHRAQIRGRTPRRWRVKDLAGLYFSAMDCGLRRRDLLRFMHHYSEGGLRRALGEDARLWRQVERRAQQLYHKGHCAQPSPDPDKMRIIRGDSWAVALQDMLAKSSNDTAAWMQKHTHLLKSDTNSRVGLLRLQHQACYLKLYRHKSIGQKWLLRLGRGRPLRSFDVACKLAKNEVPVPLPRACLLVPEGVLLLTEGIPGGRNLNDLWREQPAHDMFRQLLHGAGESVARLHRAGYAHGDCKWSNLLWTGQQCYLVDLDGVSKVSIGSAKQARDLARFTLNAEELGIGPELYELFLKRYLEGVGRSRSEAIDRMMPILRTLRERHRVKYGERGQRLL